jgi:Flp pilus assembly protein TadD
MARIASARACRLAVTALMAVGCGTHRYYNVTPDSTKETRAQHEAPGDSLGTFMAKFRELQATARAVPRPSLTTLEASDPALSEALLAAALQPSPESLHEVAEEYRRLKVFDKAHQYLNRALTVAPKDWRLHDGLARTWRDAGLPQVGLGDAYRAVHFAPQSAVARNTLGTLLQALGRRADARRQYERAARLEPEAAYAHNNLCYSWVLEGDGLRAVEACRRAVSLAPGSAMAQNNAGLAYALAGDMPAAQAAFAAAGRAAASYNTGIVHLAAGQWRAAARAFDEASAADPSLRLAAVRAAQARAVGGGRRE